MTNLIRGKSKNKDKSNYNNKIIDLTNIGMIEDPGEDFVICSHCETHMAMANEDITSNNGVVLVNKHEYYCKQCGLVKANDAITSVKKTLDKKREQTGPKLAKRNTSVFFETIRSTQHIGNHKPSFFELEDQHEEERLKGQGLIIGTCDERKS